MKRTTLYLEPDLEILLKLESVRRKQPMAEIVRAALRHYLVQEPTQGRPGAGAFASGCRSTAARSEEALSKLGFGRDR
jgi:hypothetical protein